MKEEACAKVILFGEHSVVYGKPGIAAPVRSLRTSVSIAKASVLQIIFDRDIDEKERSRIVELIMLAARELGISSLEAKIGISSSIPFSAGLGSSASLSIALLKAIAGFNRIALTEDDLNAKALALEKQFHGNPSGIDNEVIVTDRIIFFEDGKSTVIIPGKPLHLLIADTGISSDTKKMVRKVRKQFVAYRSEMDGILKPMGELAGKAKDALEEGDLKELGLLMFQNHTLLADLGVSNQELDDLVKAADDAGALGAKLSGGGGGGVVIALVTDEKSERIRKAMEMTGAKVYPTVIS